MRKTPRARWLAVAVAVSATAAVALGASGCGAPTDQAQVRDTLNRLVRATATKDYRTLCERVFSAGMLQPVLQIGMSCEQAVSRGLATVQAPRLVIRRIQMRGSTAFAAVHTSAANQPASDDVVQLVKVDGQWVVAALGTPPAAPARRVAVKSDRPMGPMQGELVPASP